MKKLLLILATVGSVVVACNKNDVLENGEENEIEVSEVEVTPKMRVDINLTKAQEGMAAGTADFAFGMLQEAVDRMETGKNIVLSPLSASFALSMLANGASGETRQEIVDVLGFTGNEISAVNEYSRKLLNELPELDNTGTLSFANSLWLNEGYGAKGFKAYDSFEKELDSSYDAEVHSYDFAKGPGLINEWCSEKTNDLIPEVLKELNPEAQMALANALYFKGVWKDEFREPDTKPERFNKEDGSYSTVKMMNGRRIAPYFANEKYAMAELPYGNGAFSFQVLLPAEGVGIEDFLAGFNGEEWLSAQSEMTSQHLDMKLPKFKTDLNENISSVLEAMGMRKMFYAKEADFSNLSDEESYVSLVQQATYFSVDEKGSEAAAVTIAVMFESSLPDKEPVIIPFHVNRPFLFILKERSTNAILFIGKVSDL